MDKEKKNYIRAWLDKATHDLLNAKIILEADAPEKPFDTVCFHCQQAGEKYLKAYCIFLDIMFPKTHNIGQLINFGMEKDAAIEALMYTDELSPYGVDIRYPDDFIMPSEQDAKRAYDLAVQIQTYVVEKTADV